MVKQPEEKRDAILEAARTVLARFGFHKTTMEDVAKEAKIGRATLYHYFEDKEAIFGMVVHHECEELLKVMRQAVAEASSPTDQFIAFVKSRYVHLRKLRSLNAVTKDVARELLPMAEKERERFFSFELELLTNVIQSGVDTGTFKVNDIELFALTAMSALRGLDATFLTYGKESRIDEGIEGVLDVVLQGLLAR